MNGADITAVSIIIIFTVIGYFMGSIRSVASLLGIFGAFFVTDQLVRNGVPENTYILAFVGIFLGATLIGVLFIGKTRMTLVESMEGVFGSILGFVIGWGVARFVFSVIMFYRPDTEFAGLIQSGMISMDIYLVTPFQAMMNDTESLRNPKIF